MFIKANVIFTYKKKILPSLAYLFSNILGFFETNNQMGEQICVIVSSCVGEWFC